MSAVNFIRRAGVLGVLLLALTPLAATAAQEPIDSSSPQRLVETAAKALLADLDANRESYRKDIGALQKSIESRFLQHVDTQYAAQQVLGAAWRTATPEQRERFVNAFKQVMLGTYGSALLDFTAENLTIKPFRGDAAASSATIDTEIKRANGASVAVSFILRKNTSGWKVWDVSIEGIRYVGVFRSDIGSEVSQKGLEAVIKRLETQQAAAK
ncbi:MAG TPA: ABC transporter substrate-binding protein [Steroidobacteraceae bacterium]|nr:ABC transporter substrate-binding protein [Steroidobacteraceae bacterium]